MRLEQVRWEWKVIEMRNDTQTAIISLIVGHPIQLGTKCAQKRKERQIIVPTLFLGLKCF